MHTGADEIVFPGDTKATVGGAGRDERRMGLDLLAARQPQAHITGRRPFGRDALDAHGAEQFDLIPPRLGDEALRQVGAPDAVGKARVVVDSLSDASLSAESAALDNDG